MKTIAVDLDGTLIITLFTNDTNQCTIPITVNNKKMFIIKRYWADSFLKILVDAGFFVGIWTAGTSEYANRILQNVFPNFSPCFVLSREQCTKNYEKNLRLFSFPIILIDNDVVHVHYNKYNQNKGCIIVCKEFHYKIYDQILLRIAQYLKKNKQYICDRMAKELVIVHEFINTRNRNALMK